MEPSSGLIKNLNFAGLLYFAAALPFQLDLTPVFAAFAPILVAFVLRQGWKEYKTVFKQPAWYLLLAYLVWNIISLIWADPWIRAGQAINRLLPLIFFLAFAPGLRYSSKEWRVAWYVFAFSVILSMFIALGMGIPHYLETEGRDTTQFFYMKLSRFLERQPHYVALYSCAGLFFLAFEVVRLWQENHKKTAYWLLLPGFLLMFYVFLLSARAQVFALIGMSILALWIHFGRRGEFLKGLGWSVLALVVLGAGMLGSPKARNRLSESVKQGDIMVDETGQSDPRVTTWKYAIETILQAPLHGHGIGAGNLALHETAKKHGSQWLVDRGLNYHNQYLQILGNTGLIGLLLFAGLCWGLVKSALQNKRWHFLCILGLTGLSFMTESMLLRMAGAHFTTFILLYILCLTPGNKRV